MDLNVLSKENQYKLVTAGAALLAGVVVKAALTAAWRAYRKADPPQNPDDRNVAWSEALAWTVASSVAMGVGGLIARRGVAGLIHKPPGAEEPIV